MEGGKEQRKLSLILVVMIFMVLFIAVVGISFALPDFSLIGKEKSNAMLLINNKEIDEQNDSFLISGLYPIDDSLSSVYSKSITFDVFSGNKNYDCKIFLSDFINGSNIDANNIKISLVKDNKYIIGSKKKGEFLSSIEYDESLNSYVLDSYLLKASEKHHYSLNVWLEDSYKGNVSYSLSDGKSNVTIATDSFSMKINADFVQK